jgi:hypothetical protein
MRLLRKLTSLLTAGAFMLAGAPAFGQTSETTPGQTTQEQGTQQSPSGMGQESMREMMREMMQDMMRQRGPRAYGEGEDRAERRGWGRWHDGRRMGRQEMMEGGGMMEGFGGGRRPGAMHGAGMRILFAIIDSDGDGALSLQEVQNFHARIFNAVDENGDGRVTSEDIQTFFHGPGEQGSP